MQLLQVEFKYGIPVEKIYQFINSIDLTTKDKLVNVTVFNSCEILGTYFTLNYPYEKGPLSAGSEENIYYFSIF